MPNTSLPFKNENVYEGFAITEGALSLRENSLVFEFITKDSVVGALKSEVKQVVVAFENIEELSFKKSIFGNKLSVRLTNFMIAQELPGQEDCEVKLRITRKNTDTAQSFVAKIQLDMSDYHYRASKTHYKEELSKAIDQA